MNPVPLDDLPQYSEWAAHVLDPVGDPPAEPERYAGTEYYEAVGQRVLEAYREDPVDAAELHRRGRAHGREDPDVLSTGADLYLASVAELVERERAAVRDALAPVLAGDAVGDPTVVDLGCGWGATLAWIAEAFPGATAIGGEYSEPAVELGRALYADHDRIAIRQFDFRGSWTPLEAALDPATGATSDTATDAASDTATDAATGGATDPVADTATGGAADPATNAGVADGVVLLTRGAVTTLSDVGAVVDRFADRAARGDVVAGVHLEQVDAHPETVLGLLRRRYARVRGYDGSLLAELRAREDLRVTAVEYDVLGANPLHPHTLVRWEPA